MKWWGIIGGCVLLYLGLAFFQYNKVPACINADEASFGYSAYSILKTGRDEYGTFLPLRLRSFGDFKLPLYSYASIPSITLFGLTSLGVRVPNVVWGGFLVLGIGILTQLIFKKRGISVIASLIAMSSVWTLLLVRQAHEGVLCSALITWAAICFVVYRRNRQIRYMFLSGILLLLSTFAYHYGRLFLLALGGYMGLSLLWKGRKGHLLKPLQLSGISLFLILCAIIPFAIDMKIGANRVSSLTFFTYPGFTQQINELRSTNNSRILYNKLTVGTFVFAKKYVAHFSPQFLFINGDGNVRFGYPGMHSIAITTYLFFFVGLYLLLKRRDSDWDIVGLLLFISPIASSLTWQDASLSRAYPLIVPLSILAAVGMWEPYRYLKEKNMGGLLLVTVVIATLLPLKMYFFEYPNKPAVIRWWQCGYKELVNDLNAHPTKNTYITRKHGQPYIYFLFYNKIDPKEFQETATFTKPDEYGFTQVEKFGQYTFSLPKEMNQSDSTYVGYSDEIKNEEGGELRDITFNSERIFSILQTATNRE